MKFAVPVRLLWLAVQLSVLLSVLLSLAAASIEAQPWEYATREEALNHAFPDGEKRVPVALHFAPELTAVVRKETGLKLNPKLMECYQGQRDGQVTSYACIDNVIGMKRYITYIIRVEHPEARIGFVEIMVYREKIGNMVRFPRFKDQFVDKTLADPIRINRDIRRIYGATFSSRGLSNGSKRMLLVYEHYLRNLPTQ